MGHYISFSMVFNILESISSNRIYSVRNTSAITAVTPSLPSSHNVALLQIVTYVAVEKGMENIAKQLSSHPHIMLKYANRWKTFTMQASV